MEWLFIVGGFFIYVDYLLKNKGIKKEDTATKSDIIKESKELSADIVSDDELDELLRDLDRPNTQNNTIINNHYHVHNTVKVYTDKSSLDNLSDHTKKIWNQMGYDIKYGETYTYKMYGKEIFTPEQVEQITTNSTKYLPSKTTPKRTTKKYNASEQEAVNNGFKEVYDEDAYNDRYFIRKGKKWIHNIDELKKELGVYHNSELRKYGYDTSVYFK